MELSDDEKELVKSFFLLTDKPVIYCANVSEDQTGGNEYTKAVEEYAKAEGSEVVVISAKIEEELASLSDDERKPSLTIWESKKARFRNLLRRAINSLVLSVI